MGAIVQGPLSPSALRQIAPPLQFTSAPLRPTRYTISGVTKDANGNPLGNCTVECFETLPANPNEPKGRLVGMATSDANGNYSIDVYAATGATFFCVGYLAGSPDVAGTTVNTLVGVSS